jgi:hypothetical protein
MGRVLSLAGAERRISFCKSVLLRIFIPLNKVQLRHLYVTNAAPVRILLLVSGNLPYPSVFRVPDVFSRISSMHFSVSTELSGLTSGMA